MTELQSLGSTVKLQHQSSIYGNDGETVLRIRTRGKLSSECKHSSDDLSSELETPRAKTSIRG